MAAASATPTPKRVLFVCLGNICRSATAEYVLKSLAAQQDPPANVQVASCGTGSFHIGEGAYPPMLAAARKRGYEAMRNHRAQQLKARNFANFDMLVAMDSQNLRDMERMCPREHKGKLKLFCRDFCPESKRQDCPDPYYEDNYEIVVDIAEEGCPNLLRALTKAD